MEVDVVLPEVMISLVFSLQGLLRTVCYCVVWMATRESEVEGAFSVGFWLRELNSACSEEHFYYIGEYYSETLLWCL